MMSLEYQDWERVCKCVCNIPDSAMTKYFKIYSFYKIYN